MRLIKGLIGVAIAASLLLVPAAALAKRGDRDHDRMPDKWEKRHHLNPRANDARKDADHDGLANLSEFRHHTDPQADDTDDDGIDDGDELRNDTDPRKDDSDDDGIDDADEVSGTVASFENGVLTIQLAADGAGTVSGTVGDATVIECDDDDHATPTANTSRDGSDDGSDDRGGDSNASSGSDDDNTGSGSTTSGSDDGPNHDAGDDHGDDSHSCTIADLKPGARVHEAKLGKGADGSTVFTKIELVPAA